MSSALFKSVFDNKRRTKPMDSKTLQEIHMILLNIPSELKPNKIRGMVRTKDVRTEPGSYSLEFENVFKNNEKKIEGLEFIRRAFARNAVSGLQHALWLKSSQDLIPQDLAEDGQLIFSGAQARGYNLTYVATLVRIEDKWKFFWTPVEADFCRGSLAVKSTRIKQEIGEGS
jgi:hypothetical protein